MQNAGDSFVLSEEIYLVKGNFEDLRAMGLGGLFVTGDIVRKN